MAQVITTAGEQLFAIKAQNNQPLDIDTFIFAYVPGQDSSAAIDRNEGLPPVGQRVHQQIVQQRGRVNSNVVIYSTVLDSVTGPFEFNWVGLYSSVNNTLVAISKIPTVVKTVTVPGTAGNILNRNFGIEYSGIADLDGITVDPETWQLDYTARLNGMDELTRQLAADMNGRDWFIDNGFKVAPLPTPHNFKVTAGAGYVSGLRIAIEEEPTLIAASYPQFVYVNAWFDGTSEATWKGQTTFQITPAEQEDYTDETGKRHYLFKLATITAANTVIDHRRPSGLRPHKSIKGLQPIPEVVQTVEAYVEGTGLGGGDFVYYPFMSGEAHEGGFLISEKAKNEWSGSKADIDIILNWAGNDAGVYKRIHKGEKTPEMYGAFGDGVTNDLTSIKRFFEKVKNGICEREYFMDIQSDEDSVSIKSDSVINCKPTSKFKYNFFGSPLFNAINQENIKFLGYTIEFNGYFESESVMGVRDFKNWNMLVPSHRFCADIVVLGCEKVKIRGIHTSESENNVQNIGVYVDGYSNGVDKSSKIYIDIDSDDRCQGVINSGTEKFKIKVNQGRLPQNSESLYGAGHAVYDVIERETSNGQYEITDSGEYVDTLNKTESHTLSIKNAKNVSFKIKSSRAAGPVNFAQCNDVDGYIEYVNDEAVDTASVALIYYTGQGGASSNNKFRGSISLVGPAHNCRIYDDKVGSLTNIINNTQIDISFKRNVSGVEAPAFRTASKGGVFNITSNQLGSNNRVVLELDGSESILGTINAIYGEARVLFTSDLSSTININGRLATRTNVPALGSGGSAISQSLARHKNQLEIESTENPNITIQLPSGGGAFLLWVNVTNSDYNNARGGLYLVVYDNASLFDMTHTQLLGTQVTKGGSEISSLTVTVNNQGLVTISTVAVLTDYLIEYGYSEMNRRKSMF